MKVKMRTIMAGPGVAAQPGEVIEVSSEVGASLVQGGYAEPVKEQPVETATVSAAETAAVRTKAKVK